MEKIRIRIPDKYPGSPTLTPTHIRFQLVPNLLQKNLHAFRTEKMSYVAIR
jgi:hypothetical protein